MEKHGRHTLVQILFSSVRLKTNDAVQLVAFRSDIGAF